MAKPTKEKHVKIRHIPRNQYGHCNIDPIMRYMYKYNFDRYCTGFDLVDKETNRREKFSTILDLMIYLTQPGGLFPEGVPDYGIPIVAEGLICIHAPLLVEEVNLDPYFKCEVIVNHLGTTEKTKKGHVEVFYVKA